MPRARISTTVDPHLLKEARQVCGDANDAAVITQALTALIRANRAAQHDAAYAAYEEHPPDTPDEWGDLESFHQAAEAS